MDHFLKTMATTMSIDRLEKGPLNPGIGTLNPYLTSAKALKKALEAEGHHHLGKKMIPSIIFRNNNVKLKRYC